MLFRRSSERGQALVLIALAAIGLVAVTGLAVDGSIRFSDRRHAQNAADTAALAGALAKTDGLAKNVSDNSPTTLAPTTCPPPSGVQPSPLCVLVLDAALDRAGDNGYDDNLVTNNVEVYSPPISGYYAGDNEYVQVIITSYVKTYFARIVRINQTQNVVQAVALAKKGHILGDGAMVISYDPDPNCSTGGTGGYSVQVDGSATVNLDRGGIFLNSDEVCGFKIPNCADLKITNGGGINSVGGNNISTGGCIFNPPIVKKFNQDPVAIPDDIYWPDVPPECGITPHLPVKLGQVVGADGKSHEEWLIYPGFYTDFPQPILVTNKSYIYMASGVYCIDPPGTQDLSWSAVDAAFLNGSTDPSKNPHSIYNPDGVTLYIKAGGGFAINGSSPTYLDATNDPDSDYQGYLVILEGTPTYHPSCTINGGADIYINGLIFAPYCNFQINGQAGETSEINAQLIGWDIKINGANAINFKYDPNKAVHIKRKVGLMR